MAEAVRLAHRSVLAVLGPDAESFLQGLLTANVAGVAPGERRHGALLTPQGKIIAEMLIERAGEAFLLDVDQAAAPDLIRRLTLFRLRARVEIAMREDLCVTAFTGFPDPRSPLAPVRALSAASDGAMGDPAPYHAARIAAGVAEQGADFAAGDVFPADINMDLAGGVDFKKGCFIGQEVVSRMKRRGTARRRTLTLRFHGPAPAPGPLLAGEDEIGSVTSIAGHVGLSRLRIDRLAEAEAAGWGLQVAGRAGHVVRPAWLDAEIARLTEGRGAP